MVKYTLDPTDSTPFPDELARIGMEPSGSMGAPESRSPEDERLFFLADSRGGTDIGAALATALDAIQAAYPARTWNRYIFVIDAEPDPQFASGEGLPEGVLAELRSNFLCDAVSPDEALASLEALLKGCACGRCGGEEKKTSD